MFEMKWSKFPKISIAVGFDHKNCTSAKIAKACGKIHEKYMSIVSQWHLQ